MRYLILFFLFLATPVFADVTAEILKYDLDESGNIRVYTQFKIDGVEVESKYPKLDGKAYLITRFDALNFLDMTQQQIKDQIIQEIQEHARALIEREYIRKTNDEIVKTKLSGLIGTQITQTTAQVDVVIDPENRTIRTIEVKTDGSKVNK